MSRLRAIALSVFLALSVSLFNMGAAWAVGMSNGSLTNCPASPNCVVSQGADAEHAIAPITYHIDRTEARKTLLKVLGVIKRTEVVEQTDNYIHATNEIPIFKFVDDVEFYLPETESVIHVRSASRIGDWDLGVNRRRVEQIRLALRDLNI